MRHQNKLSVSQVDKCFFCGAGQDSMVHMLSFCPLLFAARSVFLARLGLETFFPPSLLASESEERKVQEETKEERKLDKGRKEDREEESERRG